MNIVQQDWYQALVGECKTIVIEAVRRSRWALVEGYWNLGERIRTDQHFQEYAKGNNSSFQDLGRKLGVSTSTIYYALQFYDKYPDLSKVPEGNNISWNKLITKYLPEFKESKINISIPQGKYSTLVIDPPWPMQKIDRASSPNQVEFDYPTMSIDDIKWNLLNGKPLSTITAENCHVYLWTTQTYLPIAFEVFQAWGVAYGCLLTWVKNVGFTPFSWMYSTEHVLFGRVGSLDLLVKGRRLDFKGKVREHSRKPDEFYNLVREVSPGPRIDVFSREKREGFDQYGNELDKFKATPNISNLAQKGGETHDK